MPLHLDHHVCRLAQKQHHNQELAQEQWKREDHPGKGSGLVKVVLTGERLPMPSGQSIEPLQISEEDGVQYKNPREPFPLLSIGYNEHIDEDLDGEHNKYPTVI